VKLKSFGIVVVLALATLLCFSRPRARATTQPPQQAWEYKFVDGPLGGNGQANKLGGEGWELVAVTPPSPSDPGPVYRVYFKRPK
jgi:hypothetical protein